MRYSIKMTHNNNYNHSIFHFTKINVRRQVENHPCLLQMFSDAHLFLNGSYRELL